MNQQKIKRAKKEELTPQARVALISSLAIISVFPIFVTFAPQEWPPQPMVLVIDTAYLLLLAGYIAVLTGQPSRQLANTIKAISIIGVVAMGWLALTLASFKVNF